MNNLTLKKRFYTTLALTAGLVLLSGCSAEDLLTDTGGTTTYENTDGTSSGGSESDTFTITKTADGFKIDWHKGYIGYSEIIYQESGTYKDRGDGYPFTNNATGDYTLTCVQYDYTDDDDIVSYGCTRDDVSYVTRVYLTKGVTYEWMVNYGFDFEHGEVQAVMEYAGDVLTIE